MGGGPTRRGWRTPTRNLPFPISRPGSGRPLPREDLIPPSPPSSTPPPPPTLTLNRITVTPSPAPATNRHAPSFVGAVGHCGVVSHRRGTGVPPPLLHPPPYDPRHKGQTGPLHPLDLPLYLKTIGPLPVLLLLLLRTFDGREQTYTKCHRIGETSRY